MRKSLTTSRRSSNSRIAINNIAFLIAVVVVFSSSFLQVTNAQKNEDCLDDNMLCKAAEVFSSSCSWTIVKNACPYACKVDNDRDCEKDEAADDEDDEDSTEDSDNTYENAEDGGGDADEDDNDIDCVQAWLDMEDLELWRLAASFEFLSFSSNGRIGQYCQIMVSDDDKNGLPTSFNDINKVNSDVFDCRFQVIGRPTDGSDDSHSGIPRDYGGLGEGCVMHRVKKNKNDNNNANQECYYEDNTKYTDDILTNDERDSMCSNSVVANGAAQLRWAITNGYCTDIGIDLECDVNYPYHDGMYDKKDGNNANSITASSEARPRSFANGHNQRLGGGMIFLIVMACVVGIVIIMMLLAMMISRLRRRRIQHKENDKGHSIAAAAAAASKHRHHDDDDDDDSSNGSNNKAGSDTEVIDVIDETDDEYPPRATTSTTGTEPGQQHDQMTLL